MTDRELLELAAKAAGLGEHRYCAPWQAMALFDDVEGTFSGSSWNPLQDDGNALRLAVKLRLEFEWWKTGISANHASAPMMPIEHVGDDAYAATRRAIVRAAAVIGKAMP